MHRHDNREKRKADRGGSRGDEGQAGGGEINIVVILGGIIQNLRTQLFRWTSSADEVRIYNVYNDERGCQQRRNDQ